MKDSLKYSDLWRKKREELPVEGEAQNDWQEMQSMLDMYMPVVPITTAAHVSKVAKVVKAIKAIKATSLLLAALTVATVTGTTVYLIKNQQQNKAHNQHKSNKHTLDIDSLRDSLIANALDISDSINFSKDRLQGSSVDKGLLSATKTDSIDKVTKAGATTNNSSVKISGTPSIPGISNQRAGSVQQPGNNAANGSITGYSSANNGNYPGNTQHQNSRQLQIQNSIAKQAANDTKDTAENGSVDDRIADNDNQLSIPLMPWSGSGQASQSNEINNNAPFQPQIFAKQPPSSFLVNNYYYSRLRGTVNNKGKNGKNQINKSKATKSLKTKGSGNSLGRSLSAAFANVDWGILVGANTSGSFTPAAQNHNLYGGFPVDIYPGVSGTYHLNDKWAVNAQVRFLTPLNLSGTYTNQNDHVDSVRSVRATDSRKAYFVTIPIHAVYKINDNISVKGGPVINILTRQVGFNTSAQKIFSNVDTLFLQAKDAQIKATTRYDQKVNLGLSGGISIQANRFIFEALYQKSLSGYNVISDFHNYKNNPGTLQISVGFKLNSSKHH